MNITAVRSTLEEEILVRKKFGGNKICQTWWGKDWLMERNINFGGDLIRRMAKNIY